MQADRRTQRSYGDYAIAVVCAKEFEMSAIRYMLEHEHYPVPTASKDSNLYIFGELSGHNVILACLPGRQGKASAAAVTTDMRRSFPSVSWILLVGIGRGVPSLKNDIRLGDVVVSMPEGEYGGVVEYDLGEALENGFKRMGFLYPPPAKVRNAAILMRSTHRVLQNKVNQILKAMVEMNPGFSSYKRPSTELDVLFDPDYYHTSSKSNCDACDKTRAIIRPAREQQFPMIHYGLVASGDRLIESVSQRTALAEDIGDILCFEMEAAGIATHLPCMVIRGISQYADSHNNGSWQYYAAAAAAACAKDLLSYIPPPDLPAMQTSISLLGPKEAYNKINQPISVSKLNGTGIQYSSNGNLSSDRGFHTVMP
ncbi:hypothetical protein EMCG_02693 [[Emmonsia] crescens]|uniref:Uncharacterized protein n=1 Tax=[Emmonsia] crescens TaxID=73230 RepID=A0A0G2J8X3_9EURO|nr:hypothetical protein EMCG_02693 [Emmonsia crescens UAMH 3008]